MKNLEEIRSEINAIDDELLRLFVRRMEASSEVAEAKRESGVPIFDPKRERDILSKVAQTVGPELENEARLVFTNLFSISRARQRAELAGKSEFMISLERVLAEKPTMFPSSASVACPGAEGSYSQQAVSSIVKFPTIFYFKSFEDVFNAVEKAARFACPVFPAGFDAHFPVFTPSRVTRMTRFALSGGSGG